MITDWDKIINRIKSEVGYRLGGKDQGAVSVRLTMILDCDSKPTFWMVESKKIEPGFRARELTEDMAQELLESY